jgi:hypothetical protein
MHEHMPGGYAIVDTDGYANRHPLPFTNRDPFSFLSTHYATSVIECLKGRGVPVQKKNG